MLFTYLKGFVRGEYVQFEPLLILHAAKAFWQER
jgi:hypothetical protein